jgi:diguanylate cyclase (GGDEF)-like protein
VGDRLTCLTFTDLTAQKDQDREIARLSQAQADRLADLQKAQAALVKQATHDPLTGLPNRDVLVDRLDQALLQRARLGRCAAVYFIDLDGFKQVNDARGHAAGNQVLRGVADGLAATIRDMDTVARVGGDEFVVLAPDVASQADAVDIGNRLVQRLGRATPGAPAGIRVSIGVAISERGRGDAELVLHEADTAMYFAKSQGGGRSAVFDGMLARQVTERSDAQADLLSALDEHRIAAYYQPIVDLASGSVTGFEALARLIQPDGAVLAPASFIAVAEASGLVLPLEVCKCSSRRACRAPSGPTTRQSRARWMWR